MQEALDREIRSDLRRRMLSNTKLAADSWERSMGNAAERGDHKPSRDWLEYAGAIDSPQKRDSSGPAVIVQIGAAASDVKIGIAANGAVIPGVTKIRRWDEHQACYVEAIAE